MAQFHQLLPNRAFRVTNFDNSSQVIFDWSRFVSSCGVVVVMTSHYV